MSHKKYNILISIFSLIAAGVIGWKMNSLRLWGDLPLFFFLAIWISIVLFIENYKNATNSTNYFLILSSLSGLLLSLSFPPFGLSPLLILGLVPLFYIQDKASKDNQSALFYIYNAFVLWNIYDTYWVANAALIPGMVAIWLNSFFMLAPWIGASWVGNYLPKVKWWSFILFWISFEFLHLNWEISWPWLTLGNAWSSIPSCIQWIEYTGTLGISIWILLLNVFIYVFFFQENIHFTSIHSFFSPFYRRLVFVLLLLLLPVIFSLFRYNSFLAEGKYGEVCLVQPNYEPHYEKFAVPEMDQITRLGRLAEMSINKNSKFIVFPETCFGDSGGPIRSDKVGDDYRIITFYDFIESHFNIPIVMGITTVKLLSQNDHKTSFTRFNPRTNTAYEISNSAIILKDRMEKVPVYNKSRLVPGAEIFPYRYILPFLKPLVDKLGGSIEGLAMQKERTVFESKGYRIAPVICYESIYGNFMRGYIQNGAEAIFVMTNDGWWDDTPGYKQHMAYSRLRAIEFRKPVLRSANSGVSCFIDAKGDLGKSIGYNVHSSISQGVTFSSGLTFYAQYGDYLAYIALFGALVLVLWAFIKSRLRF